MPQYRKKPVVIEAVKWDGKNAAEINHFIPEDIILWMAGMDFLALRIRTLEGDMVADVGDWIIKGVQGELYPCKPDIFAATYDPVQPSPQEMKSE